MNVESFNTFKTSITTRYAYIKDIEGGPDGLSSDFILKVHTSIPWWDIENVLDRYKMRSYVPGGRVYYGAGDSEGEVVYEPKTVGEQVIDRLYKDAESFGIMPCISRISCVIMKYSGDGIYREVWHEEDDTMCLWMKFVDFDFVESTNFAETKEFLGL